MLCKCGHQEFDHSTQRNHDCLHPDCSCKAFVPPGAANAYESTREPMSHYELWLADERVRQQQAECSTRELVNETHMLVLPVEWLALRKQVAAANALAAACENSPDESIQARLAAFKKSKGEQ
jgi:hypothetical protein